MTTTLWLRISSVILLLFTAGHTLGGRREWSPMGDNAVLRSMKSVQFDTMGVSRSYYDFFMGFGWSLSVLMLAEAIVLWQLSALARTHAAAVRPIIAVVLLANVAAGLIAWRFIFPVPALSALAVVASLVVAWLTARPARGAQS